MVLYLYPPRTGSHQTVLLAGIRGALFTSIDQYHGSPGLHIQEGGPSHCRFLRAVSNVVGARGFLPDSSAATRDVVIEWVNDLRRSIDYLETRCDLDARAFSFVRNTVGVECSRRRPWLSSRGSGRPFSMLRVYFSVCARGRSVDVSAGAHPRAHAQRRA